MLPALLISMFAFDVWAHGGGLNSAGCHNNTKTGGYHCHRSGGYTPDATPAPNPSNAKTICTELGFSVGTTKYEECVLLILKNVR